MKPCRTSWSMALRLAGRLMRSRATPGAGKSCSTTGSAISGALVADDGDRADVLRRLATQVVDQPGLGVGQLARARPALQLQVHLVEHADAAGAHRMAEALEAAV